MNPLQYVNEELLAQRFLGITVQDWLIFVLVWVLIGALLLLAQHFLTRRVTAFARRTVNVVDDAVAEVLAKTHVLFLLAVALYLSVTLLELPARAVRWATPVAFIALLLQVVRWGNSLITMWITRFQERKLETDAAAVTTVQATGFLGRLILWFVVFLIALDNFGIDVTALIAGLGVGGIAVALAVQNILGDLFASLSIVLDKPFVVGDFLIIDEYLGTVEHIGLKTTRIRSLSGEQIVFSNGDLLKSRIRNYKRMFERRVVFSIGVTYQTPQDKLAAISHMLREIVEAQDQVRFDRAHFKEYGDFALKYEIVYYVLAPDYNLYMDIQQAINLAIYRRFAEEGIEFAYPTQSLYLKGLHALAESVDGDQEA